MSEPRIEDAPVDEATRFAESRVAKACSHVLFGLVVFYSLVVAHLLLVKVSIFFGAFRALGTSLPTCTQVLLTLRPTMVALVFLLLVGSVVKEFTVKTSRTTLILNAVHLSALAVLKEVADIAFWMPMVTLIDSSH